MGTTTTTKKTATTAATPTLWVEALLTAIGAPITQNNVSNLGRVITGETAGQPGGFLRDNNPLNLNTWGSPHASLPNGHIVTMTGQCGKTVWVQQFNTIQDGIKATADTILSSNNASLLAALRNNVPTSMFGAALSTSSWKGGPYSSQKGITNYQPATGTITPGLGTNPTGLIGQITHPIEHGVNLMLGGGQPLTGEVKSVAAPITTTAGFIGKITDPTNLKNVGIFVGGLALTVTGLVILFSATKGKQVLEVAGKVA